MSALAALLALLAAALLVARRGRLRGTTLIAPWCWACVALASLAAVELAASRLAEQPVLLSHLRFLAAGTTFCPLMALLGAKRPQDRGWQFVVLSLLGLVLFYGLTELAYRPDRPPTLHWVVRWVLIAPLVIMGLSNHLLTRYWLSAVLVALGQLLLLSPQFPELQGWMPAWLTDGPRAGDAAALTGIACLSAAGLFLGVAKNRGRRPVAMPARAQPGCLATSAPGNVGFDRVWRDFRDQFGALWGLRVAGRFNQSAEQLGWGVRLAWRGMETDAAAPSSTGKEPAGQERAMRQVLGSMLRRFVDDDWLAGRWGDGEELGTRSPGSHPPDGADCADSAGPPPRPSPRMPR